MKMAMLSQILHVPQNLEIFHNRLVGPGPRDDITVTNTVRISNVNSKFDGYHGVDS